MFTRCEITNAETIIDFDLFEMPTADVAILKCNLLTRMCQFGNKSNTNS